DDEVIDVLHNLRKIIKERESILRQNTNYVFKTSYVVFLFHNFTTPMNQFLNYIKSVSSKIDVHFVIFTINNKDIPECFKYILNVGEREQILYNIRENGIKKVVLSYDYVDIANLIDIDKFTDTLSKIKLSTEGVIKGFESRSIFGLYNASSVKDLNIEDRWRKNKLLSSLNIPVATKNFKDVFTLNIHEKHDGINGIIFGESGVGKTELLKNMILSYSINLSPNLLNFIILKSNYNIKLNNFVHLPHVIDILDKEDISEKNRLIELIKNEISRRQKLFDSIGVKDINAYLNTYENYSDTIIIPHLIIIIDDVCKNDIDFIRELSQLYSSILSIGIHIIVSSNCVSAFVKEEKILSNFDFKVCFRLSDVRDLFEIMGENEILNPNSTGKFNIRLSDS
ncbi:DNA segregation ATP-ase FtsK/SpoIIIE, partial [Candidatus Arthromitus sp. SFB-1]